MKSPALHSTILFGLLTTLFSCSVPEEKATSVLVSNIPTHDFIADSLNKAGFKAAKWAIQDGKVKHSPTEEIDWHKELESIRKINVNHQRYRDSYTVTIDKIGKMRSVVFSAKEPDQEVQKIVVRTIGGRLTYYMILKHRTSIFSESYIRFELTETTYALELKQNINWVFGNESYVKGLLIPSGELYRLTFDFGDTKAPVQALIQTQKPNQSFYIINGDERIGFNNISQSNDTLFFQSDYFDSEFQLTVKPGSNLTGRWISHKSDVTKTIDVALSKDKPYRFQCVSTPLKDLSGDHSIMFINSAGERGAPKLLRLKQTHHSLQGSVLTETGDYRYLDGIIRNDSLLLSTMDGTHAYLFSGKIDGDSAYGSFYYGLSAPLKWVVNLNEAPKLTAPEALTQAESDSFKFAFPDVNGRVVSIADSQFKNKPMVVSIMGTWCSNCLDEAQFLKEAHELYHNQGLKVVALDFELVGDSARAIANIHRHTQSLDLDYPVLLAGLKSTKAKALEAIPALSEIISFPTMIVLDKNHDIVRVHTGFNGPATGEDTYNRFRKEYLTLFGSLVEKE